MPTLIDFLSGAVTFGFLVAGLFFLRFWKRTGARVLLWSALCFVFLAGNNLVVIFDLLVLPAWDFRLVRHGLSLAAVGVILFGFIWDLED